jgi:hypothetical protein
MIFTYNLQKIELGILLALFTRLRSYGFASDSVLVEWLLILFFYLEYSQHQIWLQELLRLRLYFCRYLSSGMVEPIAMVES